MIDITPHGWVGAQPPTKEPEKPVEPDEKSVAV
jgi:hypothetical protein